MKHKAIHNQEFNCWNAHRTFFVTSCMLQNVTLKMGYIPVKTLWNPYLDYKMFQQKNSIKNTTH